MLTATFDHGQPAPNPNKASASALDVHQCTDGEPDIRNQFDIRNRDGVRLAGPFRLQDTANSAARMLSMAAACTERTAELLGTMTHASPAREFRSDEADRMFPEGCKCGNNGGGDCDWCREYYAVVS